MRNGQTENRPAVPNDSAELRLSSEIADRAVKELFERFVTLYSAIHDEIEVQANNVEIRFFFRDGFLCRLAPYRDLFHVQVGEDPAWETRVRTEAAFFETVDRSLGCFLKTYALTAR